MPLSTTHLDNDEVNVIVYEDLEPFPQLLMDFFFALAIPISTGYSPHISTYLHIYISNIYPPVRGSLDDAPRHDGAPLVRGGPGDAAAGRVDLQTLHSTVTTLHPPPATYRELAALRRADVPAVVGEGLGDVRPRPRELVRQQRHRRGVLHRALGGVAAGLQARC